MVIQGIMGGLQKNLILRSKQVHGSAILRFESVTEESLGGIKDFLSKNAIPFYSELEIEVMLKNKNYVAPAKLHGIDLEDNRPSFISDKDFKGIVVGSELARKINLQYLDSLQIIAPGMTDALMGEVPRFLSETMTDYLYTEQPEVDEFESWVRLEMVQNLLRQRGINQIRIFGDLSEQVNQKLAAYKTQTPFKIIFWEQMNEALVWSLNLETKVMLFLFISMGFLVSVAITSGLLIFYSKIKKDLMSFWILGLTRKLIEKLCFKLTLMISGASVFFGGICGIGALKFIELYGHQVMPEVFLERQIPVALNLFQVLISLLIPFFISAIFSYFSFIHFRKENQSFVSIVRSIG